MDVSLSRYLRVISLTKGHVLKDIVHYLLSLHGLVVKDEGDAAPHHLQPASTVEH